MLKLYLWIRNMLEGEEGQDLVEYALILVLISVVAISLMYALGGQIGTVFSNITGTLQNTPVAPS